MKTPIKTLAMSLALVAFSTGIAMAQDSTPAPAKAKTETKTTMKKTSTKPAKVAKAPAHKWTTDEIKDAQEALTKGGYYKGTATGTWTKATKTALKAWQKANKMPVTGKLTEAILDKMKAS